MSNAVVAVPTNPYPGLAPFENQDAARFFGRDREIEEILDRMAVHRLLAVIGVSGCGKSSLVRAGVIPILKMGIAPKLPAHWRICIMTPGANPLGALRAGLEAPEGWPATSFDLTDYARKTLSPGETLLLIVDQFEELFRFRDETLAQDGGNAAALFVNVLLNAVEQREVPIYVLLAMRTDFLGKCSQFRGLPEALNDCYYMVPRLTRLQQQEAIERPLREMGESMHPAVVQHLLNDSAEDPDHLPVLQHLLRRLWENWSERKKQPGEPIGDTDYKDVGGWANALNLDAEAIMKEFASDQDAIRRLFQWITERGTSQQPVRRPRSFGECVRVCGVKRERLKDIVTAFQKHGLLRPSDLSDGSLVDLPHESVMWQWTRLRRWIIEEAERAALGRFILDSARQTNLLRGLALGSAVHWRNELQTQRESAQRYLKAEDLKAAEDWVLRSERFEQNKQFRRKWIMRGIGALVPLLVAVAFWVVQQQRNSKVAKERELFAWAAVSLQDDPERSMILGLLSWAKQRAMVPGLEELLHTAILQSSVRLTLVTQKGSVADVAWSPDGSKLATAYADSTVTVWDRNTGKVMTVKGHEGGVNSVAWSPDGSRLATAGADWTSRIWDGATGTLLMTLKGHKGSVNSVAWSRDGKLATASADHTAKVWDGVKGNLLVTLSGHQGIVYRVAWSPDGTKVATGSEDETAKIWDAGTGKELMNIAADQSAIMAVTWSPDGKRLATAGGGQIGKVWDALSGKWLLTLKGHEFDLTSIAWSPDGSKLATASYDRTARLWNATTGHELQTLRGHNGAVNSVAWSQDGSMVATASDDGTAKAWEPGPGELWSLDKHKGPVMGIAWSPDSSKIATASWDGTGKVWDAHTGKDVLTLAGHQGPVAAVVWSPDGTKLATASYDDTARVWDATTAHQLLILSGHTGLVESIVWSRDGTRLATGSSDKTARVWNANTGGLLLTLAGHQGAVTAVAWSSDQTKLATASNDKTAKVWDASTGQELLTLSGHQGWVTSVAWSHDGTRLATASFDQTARVWDASTGKELRTLFGHQSALAAIAWSPDGSKLATASWDKTVKIWEASTGAELLTLRGHQDTVFSVAWSPDGNRIASGGADRIGQVYVTNPNELLHLVRTRITRNLTPDECTRYLDTSTCPPLPDMRDPD